MMHPQRQQFMYLVSASIIHGYKRQQFIIVGINIPFLFISSLPYLSYLLWEEWSGNRLGHLGDELVEDYHCEDLLLSSARLQQAGSLRGKQQPINAIGTWCVLTDVRARRSLVKVLAITKMSASRIFN